MVSGHPAAVSTARELARRGQRLVAQEDGAVLVVNVPVYGPPVPAWRAATP